LLTANEGKLTVALDISVTEELLKEGIARELVNRIQNIRKQNGFEITDRIAIEIEKRDEINDAVTAFSGYIASQTLAADISLVDKLENGVELDFDEFMVKVNVEKTR
jgi:isoleucyl-tRNA synthetase